MAISVALESQCTRTREKIVVPSSDPNLKSATINLMQITWNVVLRNSLFATII